MSNDLRALRLALAGKLAIAAAEPARQAGAAPPATTDLAEARARLRASLNAMIQQRAAKPTTAAA